MVAVVKCPCCRTEVEWTQENRYRPFCSRRCRMTDLGAWAQELYKVEAAPSDDFSETGNP